MTMPSCYGQVWEGIVGSLCVDQGCGVIDDCLGRFASGVLVDWQRKLGEGVTVAELAQATAVKPGAIEKALEFQKTMGIIPFLKPAVISPPAEQTMPLFQALPQGFLVPETDPKKLVRLGVESVEEPAVGTYSRIIDRALSPTEVKQLYESESKEVLVDPPLAEVIPIIGPAASALEEVAGMAKKKGRGKAKAEPKGKLPRGAKKGADQPITLRPKSAGTVKSARVPARKRQAMCAKPVSARGGSKQEAKRSVARRWDPRYNRSRWQRERERSSLIAQLRPGMKLRRLWQGATLEVVVLKGGYKFQDQLYPTLYSVVQRIVGTMSRAKQKRADGTMPTGTREIVNWSAPRFFRLPWIIGGRKGST